MLIRIETQQDIDEVFKLNQSAFETDAEATLVNTLRQAAPCISLVAENQGKIVGHILFSPVTLDSNLKLKVAGLAPMAVTPEFQNSGIGGALIRAGLNQCIKAGYEAVVVLGHANYYPRFGFKPSTEFNIRSEYDVPDEVFMALELKPEALRNASGIVQYHDAFRTV